MNRHHNAAVGSVLALLVLAHNGIAEEFDYTNYRAARSAAAGLYNAGNFAGSKPAFEAAVKLATTEREKNDVYAPLVKVYSETGEYEKMFEAAEYVVENASYDAAASLTIRSLLSSCQRKNQLQEYEKRYTKLLQQDPKSRLALQLLAEYYYTVRRDFKQRAELLSRLITLDEEQGKEPDPELHYNLAFSLKLSRDNEEAAELFEKTAEMSEDSQSMCLMEAAEAWQRADQMDNALAAAQKAHDLGPDKTALRSLYRWHRTLGEVFLAGKMKEQALAQLADALEHAPIDTYKKQCTELIDKAQAL